MPQFCYIKVGFKGVYIARTCFPDDVLQKKKIKDSLAVPGEVKKKKKKKLILQDGEKPALKKPNLTQDKDKAKP